MNHERKVILLGVLLLAAALCSVICLCTNTRIDPELRSSYDRPAESASENADMNLLLQMLNGTGESSAEEAAEGRPAETETGLFRPYGWMLGVSALLGSALFTACLSRKKRYAAPFAAAACMLAGLVFSRLVFWLANIEVYLGQSADFPSILRVPEGGLSMSGALLGAGLGCLLAARLLRDPDLSFPVLADAAAPGLALFIACERCHEWVLLEQNYGRDVSFLNLFSVQGPYSPVLATGRISSLAALALLAVLLTARRRPGERALLFLFLYGTAQILLESLRQDHHMQWNFVYAQQVFAAVAAAAALIAACPRRWVRSLAVSLLTAGCATFLEFALDGRIRPPFAFMAANVRLYWYLLFILVLAGYLVYGLRLFAARRKESGC